AREFLADETDRNDAERNGGNANEDEDDAALVESLVDEEPDGADQRRRLLEEFVGKIAEGVLELPGVRDAAGHQITGVLALEKRQGEELQLFEIIEAQRLQHAHAAVLNEVNVKVAGD